METSFQIQMEALFELCLVVCDYNEISKKYSPKGLQTIWREKILLYGKCFKQLVQDLANVAKNANRSFLLSPRAIFALYNKINPCLTFEKLCSEYFWIFKDKYSSKRERFQLLSLRVSLLTLKLVKLRASEIGEFV